MPPKSSKPSDVLLDTWGRKNRKLADRACPQCGRVFRPRQDRHKYCSRPCAWANNKCPHRPGDSWWVNARGYIEGVAWVGDSKIHVKQHRWAMESFLGRKLEADEDVHHINGIKTDNRIENLQVIAHGEHTVLTNKERHSKAKATS